MGGFITATAWISPSPCLRGRRWRAAPVEELLPALLPYILGALEAMEDCLRPAPAWNPDDTGPAPAGDFLRV